MSGTNNLTGAEDSSVNPQNESQKVKDVYIGLFFDGTSNNMLQKSAYEKFRNKKTDMGVLLNWVRDDVVISKWTRFKYKSALSRILEVQKDTQNKDNKATDADYKVLQETLGCDEEFINKIKKIDNGVYPTETEKKSKIKHYILKYLGVEEVYENVDGISVDEMLKLINAHNKVRPQNTKNYSNVGILYYILKFEPKEKSSIVHTIYIEGSGATDISAIAKDNTNGLGFGLGKAGVVALVSKAVKYVSDFINSKKAEFSSGNVNLHFIVFGFSRGSTCARLFSYLIARNKDKEDKSLGRREEEFSQYDAANLFKENRLSFLEEFPNTVKIKKTVDFLGIYDTVASIGLLKQKDGWSNPCRMAYSWAPRYNDNWHYKNVTEYGLFSPSMDKVIKTCHICALDEFRENFAITDIGRKVPNNGVEIFIPGCHSDVGGGYCDSDEEQEILLRKAIECGDEIDITIDRKREGKSRVETVMNYVKDMLPSRRNNVQEKQVFFNKSFIPEEADKDDPLLLELYSLGWLDKNWKNTNRCQIKKNGRDVPCTIRAVGEGRSILFKRNVAAGYSNIPLRMMKTYAEECINIIKGDVSYGDKTFLDIEYPVPKDLKEFGETMQEKMKGNIVGKRIWWYPEDDGYKKLRLKYLHFTSTDNILMGHFNAPWTKQSDDVRIFEGNMGNLGNTTNHDLNGQICRIVYHGDKGDYSLNYMYDLSIDEKEAVPCNNVEFCKQENLGL